MGVIVSPKKGTFQGAALTSRGHDLNPSRGRVQWEIPVVVEFQI